MGRKIILLLLLLSFAQICDAQLLMSTHIEPDKKKVVRENKEADSLKKELDLLKEKLKEEEQIKQRKTSKKKRAAFVSPNVIPQASAPATDSTISAQAVTTDTANTPDSLVTAEESGCNIAALEFNVNKLETGGYSFVLIDTNTKKQSAFTLNEVTQSVFTERFWKIFLQIADTNCNATDDSDYVNNISKNIYQSFLEASANFSDERPQAGLLKLNNAHIRIINPYQKKEKPSKDDKKDSINSIDTTTVVKGKNHKPGKGKTNSKTASKSIQADTNNYIVPTEIQIKFEDGNIDQLCLIGYDSSKRLLKFENIYPISFSVTHDFAEINDILLHETNFHGKYYKEKTQAVKLADVLQYYPTLRNYTRSYSPADTTINITYTNDMGEVNLFCETSSKILQAEVFSDLLGLDEDNPNGIVQTSVKKRFSVSLPRSNKFFHRYSQCFNYGEIQFVEPSILISKIDNNNKRLSLTHYNDTVGNATTSYATALDLLRYQNYRVGFLFNTFFLDCPRMKSTWYLNGGVYFSRTPLVDSMGSWDSTKRDYQTNGITKEFGVNIFQFEGQFVWSFRPEKRYGFELVYHVFKLLPLDNQISYLNKNADGSAGLHFSSELTDKRKMWFHGYEIKAFISPYNNDNKLFFRYQNTVSMFSNKISYAQIQLGYNFYINKAK